MYPHQCPRRGKRGEGLAPCRLGQFPQAVVYADQARKKAPNDPKATQLYQSLLTRGGSKGSGKE